MTENPTSQVRIGICPGCGARIRFQKFELGEFVVCEECGDELEVVQTNPIKLDWAYSEPYEGEDWDDDDDDWDDDDYEDYEDNDDWDD